MRFTSQITAPPTIRTQIHAAEPQTHSLQGTSQRQHSPDPKGTSPAAGEGGSIHWRCISVPKLATRGAVGLPGTPQSHDVPMGWTWPRGDMWHSALCGSTGLVCCSHCVTPVPWKVAGRADKAAISGSRQNEQQEGFVPPAQMRVLQPRGR